MLTEILSELAKAEAEGALDTVLGVMVLGPFSVLPNSQLKPRGENSFRVIFLSFLKLDTANSTSGVNRNALGENTYSARIRV